MKNSRNLGYFPFLDGEQVGRIMNWPIVPGPICLILAVLVLSGCFVLFYSLNTVIHFLFFLKITSNRSWTLFVSVAASRWYCSIRRPSGLTSPWRSCTNCGEVGNIWKLKKRPNLYLESRSAAPVKSRQLCALSSGTRSFQSGELPRFYRCGRALPNQLISLWLV